MQKINKIYNWLDEEIGERVKNAARSYFELNFKSKLVSVSDFESIKEDSSLRGELFYTCKFPIKNKQNVIFRISSDFIRIIFHDIFGSSYPVFNLESLTNLEKVILNNFFKQVMGNLNEIIIKDEDIEKIDPLEKTNLNLCFLVQNENVSAGKIALTIPVNRFMPKEVKLTQSFDFEDFEEEFICVDIETGYSKILLSELKSLEIEDIIVLEKSNIRVMTLRTEFLTKEFKVNPEPSIMIEDDDDDDFEEESLQVEIKGDKNMPDKTMWDDIQIEVSAEFKKVKMKLGELKQISKGLVIDLGTIINNEISLLVENKTVAKGELVIINDKYGVKITEVYASKKEEDVEVKKPLNQPNAPVPNQAVQNKAVPPRRPIPQKPMPQAPKPNPALNKPQAPKPQAQKEDFDYSNFEE